MQLLRAINTVDARRGLKPWSNVMAILSEKDGADSELLVYGMTLVNKVGGKSSRNKSKAMIFKKMEWK